MPKFDVEAAMRPRQRSFMKGHPHIFNNGYAHPCCIIVLLLMIQFGSYSIVLAKDQLLNEAHPVKTSGAIIHSNNPKASSTREISGRLQKWYSTSYGSGTRWQAMASDGDYTVRTAIALLHVRTPSASGNTEGLEVLDVEPLCECPNLTEVKSKTFKLEELRNREARVKVTLELTNGDTRSLTLTLHKSKKWWQIDNVQSNQGFDLQKLALRNQVPPHPTGALNEHSKSLTRQLQYWYDHHRVSDSKMLSNPRGYFTGSTASLLIRIKKNTPPGEMSIVSESDPFTESQDPSALNDVRFNVLHANHREAAVDVKISYRDNSTSTVRLHLSQEKNGWRVHNIAGSEGGDFRQQMQQAIAEFGY